MAAETKIEWCEHTFNPWIGCTKISPACDNCYAEADFDKRRHVVKWGAGQPRHRTSESYWKQPLKWDREAEAVMDRYEDALSAAHAFKQSSSEGVCFSEPKPLRPRVFCASLADVFDNEVPGEWRLDLFDLIRQTPNLSWMILTKRIGNVSKMLSEASRLAISIMGGASAEQLQHPLWDLLMWLEEWSSGLPPKNVHLGATICNQPEADRDIPKLLAVPAHKRFVSIEPMLGPIVLPRHDQSMGPSYSPLDLVICGMESGPNARPGHPDWARSLRDQCAAEDVPFFFKQWGEFTTDINAGVFDTTAHKVRDVVYVELDGKHGPITLEADGLGYPAPENHDWHWDTCFGETLNPGAVFMQRVGKKAAGRLLDGVTHDGRIL